MSATATGHRADVRQAFDELLDEAMRRRRIGGRLREPLQFRLDGRRWYAPDFLVVGGIGIPRPATMIQVLGGYVCDEALADLKAAARQYPCFSWLVVSRDDGGGWLAHAVNGDGIGANPIRVPWIHG